MLIFLGLGILLGFVLALLLCPSAHGQERRTYTVPFHGVNGMILLDGQINGKPAVFLLDTGANNSVVDYRAAGFPNEKLEILRSTGSAGAEGACIVREVRLSLEHRSWLNRRVCIMDLSDASKQRVDDAVVRGAIEGEQFWYRPTGNPETLTRLSEETGHCSFDVDFLKLLNG